MSREKSRDVLGGRHRDALHPWLDSTDLVGIVAPMRIVMLFFAVVWLVLKEGHERWKHARLRAATDRLLKLLDDCDPAP
jgi:hypothetical protein